MPDLASVNGRITAIDEAVVPIDDRGFYFGDAVYEGLRAYGGRPFALDRHQARLKRSLGELGITGVDVDAIGAAVEDLLARSGLSDAVIYYQVSRGVHPRDHAPPPGLLPTIVITVREAKRAINDEAGVAAITAPDVRWGRVDIKTTNLLPNALARWQAKESGAYEAILLAGDLVREACATSVAAVIDGRFVAPPHGPWILPSITRAIAEELCAKAGVPTEARHFTKSELLGADEILLLGSSTEIVGVVRVDGAPVGGGRVGPITKRLAALYRAHIAETLSLTPGR